MRRPSRLQRELIRTEPNDATQVGNLIRYLGNLGEVEGQVGRVGEAKGTIREALGAAGT